MKRKGTYDWFDPPKWKPTRGAAQKHPGDPAQVEDVEVKKFIEAVYSEFEGVQEVREPSEGLLHWGRKLSKDQLNLAFGFFYDNARVDAYSAFNAGQLFGMIVR